MSDTESTPGTPQPPRPHPPGIIPLAEIKRIEGEIKATLEVESVNRQLPHLGGRRMDEVAAYYDTINGPISLTFPAPGGTIRTGDLIDVTITIGRATAP